MNDIVDIRDVTFHDGLTNKQNFYVYWRLLGFTPKQSAKRSGYTDPTEASSINERNKQIAGIVSKMQQDAKVKYDIDRDSEVGGIFEALSVAREQSDPKIMIQAWTEIARITGVQAPEVKEIRHTGNVDVNHIRSASDRELLELVGRERTIEPVEYEVVDDDMPGYTGEEEEDEGATDTGGAEDDALHPGADEDAGAGAEDQGVGEGA